MAKWLEERPRYAEFGKIIEDELRVAVSGAGFWCSAESRAKEPDSLIKKLLKGKHKFESLPDKVGVRCILRYRGDLDDVLSIARSLFDCSDIDLKANGLGTEKVGYVSIHARICLRNNDERAVQFPSSLFWAELQIRTLAQHLWSEMAHDSIYKNDAMLTQLPVDYSRRVNLMAGLIEVADREFDRLSQEIPLDSTAELYKALERYYYRLATRPPDAELSLEIIRLLEPLYKTSWGHTLEKLNEFFDEHEKTLKHIYAVALEGPTSALLYQPEALMIYERLEHDQFETRQAWGTRFPERELERLAVTFGISFD